MLTEDDIKNLTILIDLGAQAACNGKPLGERLQITAMADSLAKKIAAMNDVPPDLKAETA